MPSAIAHLKEWREPFRIRVAIKKQNDYSRLNIFKGTDKNSNLQYFLHFKTNKRICGKSNDFRF